MCKSLTKAILYLEQPHRVDVYCSHGGEITSMICFIFNHDDVIKWKHFPRYWQFVRGIHRSPVNSPHKDKWWGALMFSSIYVWINGWVNNREAGDNISCRAHYDVIIMDISFRFGCLWQRFRLRHSIEHNQICTAWLSAQLWQRQEDFLMHIASTIINKFSKPGNPITCFTRTM